jgi:hypothetical protein
MFQNRLIRKKIIRKGFCDILVNNLSGRISIILRCKKDFANNDRRVYDTIEYKHRYQGMCTFEI